MKRKLAGAVITMLLASLAAGCGDDDDKGKAASATTTATTGSTITPGTTRPTIKHTPAQAAFVARADAICKATTDRIQAGGAKLRKAGAKNGYVRTSQVVTFLKQTSLPAYDRMIADLRKLAPPKGDEQAINGWIALLARAVSVSKANPEKYAKPNIPDPFAAANQRAQLFGMKVCGS
ncbi:MAG: hypothetical protein H0W96_05575 [Solirubrobacterales bacterium]|nr:hypothetical protein [Solirubrobacterales bacterium]